MTHGGPRFAFHPVHAHVGRVIVAAPEDPAVPRHLGFDVAASVEEAVALAEHVHGPDCAIGYVEQPVYDRLA